MDIESESVKKSIRISLQNFGIDREIKKKIKDIIDDTIGDINVAIVRFIKIRSNEYQLRFLFPKKPYYAKGLWIAIFRIPRTEITAKNDERICIAMYLSRETPVEKYTFLKARERIGRELKEFCKKDSATEYHYFIYFIGYGFSAGVYESKKIITSEFIKYGFNVLFRLINLRSGMNPRNIVYLDLKNYFAARINGFLYKDFSKSKNKIHGSLKALVDYLLMILAYLKNDTKLILEIEDLARYSEYDVNYYRSFVASIIGPPKPRKEKPSKIESTPVAATGIERSSNNSELVIKLYGDIDIDSEELEEEEEAIDDRFERVDSDVEVL